MKSIIFFIGLAAFFLVSAANGQNFSPSTLKNLGVNNPTSLDFGPDGRLYVAQQDGRIKVVTVNKAGPRDYSAQSVEDIMLIKEIPNHNDDGTANSDGKRLVVGLLVAGTASNPIIYVTSSDSRIGAGSDGDVNLDTNSGILSKLYKNNGSWAKIDLVRGLPRSEENHATNGMALDEQENVLLMAVGGGTNAGAPSAMWTYITEYCLAAAVLSIDLDAIEAMPTKGSGNNAYKYDLPTLDDPTRPNNNDGTDVNDPFGGNDGLNQAKIVEGGPVQIFASGFRNPYDVIISKTPGKERRVYTIDNGPNRNWGGWPDKEGPDGTVTNNYVQGETGTDRVDNVDGLHHIGRLGSYTPGTYYGGHPCPIRANPEGAGLYTSDGSNRVWRTSKTDPTNPLPQDWPPVPVSMANAIEGDFQNAGTDDLSLITFTSSTNGFCEYTASGPMQGDLLATSFTGEVYRIRMNADGTGVLNQISSDKRVNQDDDFASGFNKPLDIIAQGDGDVFPGTIWMAEWGGQGIVVFEPSDIVCDGSYDSNLDEDGDGYSNADEIDNSTNPCAGSSRPSDNDKDLVSDLRDDDDDNDGIPDREDYFAIDASNGDTTKLPTHYHLFNKDPGTGFFGLGFTGLMCNKTTDYLDQFNEDHLIAGGAVGAFTIEEVTPGDAIGTANNQDYGFQFGVNVSSATGSFTVKAGMSGFFFDNKIPADFQSQGVFIGTGDQDNFLMLALNGNGGGGGVIRVHEVDGTPTIRQFSVPAIPQTSVNFFFTVDPVAGTVQPYYVLDDGERFHAGPEVQLQGELLSAVQSTNSNLAVGVISTSRGATPYNATWDYISVYQGSITGSISKKTLSSGEVTLYPNPVTDNLNLHFEKASATPLTVEIYTAVGTLIASYKIPRVGANADYGFSVPEVTPGFYMVKLRGEDGAATEAIPFIKK